MNISFKDQERICVPLMRNDYEKINKAVLEIPEAVLEIPDYEGSLKGYRCSRLVLASVRACWPFYVQEIRRPCWVYCPLLHGSVHG